MWIDVVISGGVTGTFGSSDVAFVVPLDWEPTFNGFVVTRPGPRTVEGLVATELPARVVYLALLVGGFAVALAPASPAALSSPFAPPVNPTTLAAPGWMRTVEIATLLAGHVLAIWTAHAIAFDCVPGRLQAIRSQVPFVVVMVCYTALSLWLLTLQTMEPVYVAG